MRLFGVGAKEILCAGLAVVLVLGGGATSASAASKDCKRNDPKNTTTLAVGGSVTETKLYQWITHSGTSHSTKSTVIPRAPLGGTKVVVQTCKRNGKWGVTDYWILSDHRDLDITINGTKIKTIRPARRSEGAGVFVDKVTSSALHVQAITCERGRTTKAQWLKKGATAVLGFLPLGRAVNLVAKAVLKLALPNSTDTKSYCAQVGSIRKVPLKVSSSGAVSLTFPDKGYYTNNAKMSIKDPSACTFYRWCQTDYTYSIRIDKKIVTK